MTYNIQELKLPCLFTYTTQIQPFILYDSCQFVSENTGQMFASFPERGTYNKGFHVQTSSERGSYNTRLYIRKPISLAFRKHLKGCVISSMSTVQYLFNFHSIKWNLNRSFSVGPLFPFKYYHSISIYLNKKQIEIEQY